MLSTWCEKCPYFKRFNREMAEEEDAFFEKVEKIRKYGYPKSFSDFKKESEEC
jgi:hypothetical protein